MAMNPFLREELQELIAEGIKNGEIQEYPRWAQAELKKLAIEVAARWTQTELKTLAIEIAACMPPVQRPTELVASTGEVLSQDAMDLARLYDRATVPQRQALDAVAALIRVE